MKFNYAYRGHTSVNNHRLDKTQISFAPDLKRDPTYFAGKLRKPIEFRESISALHDVVVSDLRFKPKDKTAYKEWAAQNEQLDWQQVAKLRQETQQELQKLQNELTDLTRRQASRMASFYKARQRYFDFLYKKDKDAWFVLDPVITVHPDEIFFECFSQDESSYGRLGASYEVFEDIEEFACGTTNIDYSAALYEEFQKIRTYKTTRFQVDPGGFDVETTGEDSYREVKIDLPDSWVRGFLQVNSAMTLPLTSFQLHPMDVYNICFLLRRRKEKQGPRSMRYLLEPGKPIKILFEPWNRTLVCPRSIYQGNTSEEIRIWGRRRLHILERLLPVTKHVTVHLLGTGLPSFYVADLGDMNFTLGLSGWTANDWAKAGNFDLMAPREDVDQLTKNRVFQELKQSCFAKPDDLASKLSLDRSVVLGALGAYTQAGRAIFDLNKGVYRLRELSQEPLPIEKLRFDNPREEKAAQFLRENKAVKINSANTDLSGALNLRGTVKERSKTLQPSLIIDGDQRIVRAECSCYWYQQNKLYKGPCEHMLALRMQHSRNQRKS